jgi:hypothetical protein
MCLGQDSGVFMSRVPPSCRFLFGGNPRIKRRRIKKRQDSELRQDRGYANALGSTQPTDFG